MRYYFMKLAKPSAPWPQVGRLKIRELIGGLAFGSIFLSPFIYGQYSYKTRTGLSGLNFNPLDHGDIVSANSEKATNFIEILQSDVKPGDHY